MRDFIVILTVASVFCFVGADFGSCRYDADKCSCKYGSAREGTCWDKIVGEPGKCKRRFCKSGWACACGERTHICHRGNKPVNVLANPADADKQTAACNTDQRPLVSSQDIKLGTIRFHFSKPGMLANDCSQIAWWHQGELLGDRRLINPSTANVNAELSERENHSKLELRPGDLIAFRIKDGSYYCYKQFSEFVINETVVTTNSAGVETFFSREYDANWFMPSYELTPARRGQDESDPNLKKFLPLRPKKFTSDTPIVSGNDYWQPTDPNNEDNKKSNWYYRIHIPDALPA